MTPKTFISLLGTLALFSLPLHADDSTAILQQIDSNSAQDFQAVPQGTPSSSGMVKVNFIPLPKKKVSHRSSGGEHSRKITIWGPRDKLPKDVAGQGVAGDFVLMGEYVEGGEMLAPAEDIMNPFARTFIVVNVSSGFPRGTYLDLSGRTLIHVPRSTPLIFIGRGGLIGSYAVQQK